MMFLSMISLITKNPTNDLASMFAGYELNRKCFGILITRVVVYLPIPSNGLKPGSATLEEWDRIHKCLMSYPDGLDATQVFNVVFIRENYIRNWKFLSLNNTVLLPLWCV